MGSWLRIHGWWPLTRRSRASGCPGPPACTTTWRAVFSRSSLSDAAPSLGAKLLAASAQLGRGELEAACHALRAFQDELAAQDGEALTGSQVVRLDGRARGVEQVLGCGAR